MIKLPAAKMEKLKESLPDEPEHQTRVSEDPELGRRYLLDAHRFTSALARCS